METNKQSKKSMPKYVDIYTKILGMIQDGLYPEGTAIPSEPELSKKLGVSRMTLRQALALLQEDGIIETKHGIGNFVKKVEIDTQNKDGIEKLGNPIYKCLNCSVDKIETEYRLDASDSYTNMIFHRETAVFMGVSRKYYHEKACVAFSFSYIPTDIEELQTVNLKSPEQLEQFLDVDIYKKVHLGQLEIKGITGNKTFASEVPFTGNGNTILIIENLKNSTGDILVYTKYNLAADLTEFHINQFN